MSTRLDPAGFANAVVLVSSDIPADMTLAQWRRERTQMSRSRRRRMIRILRRLRGF